MKNLNKKKGRPYEKKVWQKRHYENMYLKGDLNSSQKLYKTFRYFQIKEVVKKTIVVLEEW